VPPPKKVEIGSYFSDEVPDALNIFPQGKPSLESYLLQEPGSYVKPSDNVPGTKATWGDSIKNFLDRVVEEADRAKQKKTEEYQGHPGLEETLRKHGSQTYGDGKLGNPSPSRPPEKPAPVPQKQVANPPRSERPPTPPKLESPTSVPAAPVVTKAPAELLAELDGLIGLDEVKAQVRKTVNLIGLGKAREKAGLPHLDLTHHLVFTGNPGTGKTTVARLVGRIYKEVGLLKSGHMIEADRGDLVGEYVGQTAPKTKEVIERAMDGVLFIDEAYSLAPPDVPNDFGKEVISTLIKTMEDSRGRLVVIVAGYKEEMEHMIGINPGLKSRFKTVIDFQDYSPAELFKILVHMAAEAGIRFSVDAMTAASWLMESLDTGKKGFGNGRTVRNIFEEILARQAERLAGSRGRKVDVTIFEKEDIPEKGEKDFA
jgi:hypothetical protein